MRIRSGRSVEELYLASETASKPQVNVGSSHLKHSLLNRSNEAVCNVCSAPCSLCLHFNQVSTSMESNVDSGSSGNASVMQQHEDGRSITAGERLNSEKASDDREISSCNTSSMLTSKACDDLRGNANFQLPERSSEGSKNEDREDAMESANPCSITHPNSSDGTKDAVGEGMSIAPKVQEEHRQENSICKNANNSGETESTTGLLDNEKQSNVSSENIDDEELEEDVKVCDICGDEGQEDLLAICSRCNDGAEHTYCMRVMLEGPPDGKWLCEECQIELDNERPKKKPRTSATSSKAMLAEGKTGQQACTANVKGTLKIVDEMHLENKALTRTEQVNDLASKGDDDSELTRTKDCEQRDCKMDESDLKKKGSLSEISLKLEAEKGKQQLQASDAYNLSVPPFPGSQSKTRSLRNSKVPKVKQINEEIPQMSTKGSRELSNNVRKDGSSDYPTKSASFKNTINSELVDKKKSRGTSDNDAKTVSDKELTSSKNTTVGRTATNMSTASGTSAKANMGVGKSKPSSTSAVAGVNQGSDSGKSLGPKEMKKPLISILPLDIIGNGGSNSYNSAPVSIQKNTHQSLDSIQRAKSFNERHAKAGIDSNNKFRDAIGTASFINLGKLGARSVDQSKQPLKSSLELNAPMKSKDGLPISSNSIRVSAAANVQTWGHEVSKFSNQLEKTESLYCQFNLTVSTFPELQYIWQGSFEVWRTGKTREICHGFQAHLSSSASSKVQQAMARFPNSVRLEEIPRRNSWPLQFQENGPTEDNIALFFFAKDTESYEHHYSKLVENMVKKDLALRGAAEAVELLIFPSSLLPKNFHRWNALYFLWGLFRVKKLEFIDPAPNPLEQSCKFSSPTEVEPKEASVSSLGIPAQGTKVADAEVPKDSAIGSLPDRELPKESCIQDASDKVGVTPVLSVRENSASTTQALQEDHGDKMDIDGIDDPTEYLQENHEDNMDIDETRLSNIQATSCLKSESCRVPESSKDNDGREANEKMNLDNGVHAGFNSREDSLGAELSPKVHPLAELSTGENHTIQTSGMGSPNSKILPPVALVADKIPKPTSSLNVPSLDAKQLSKRGPPDLNLALDEDSNSPTPKKGQALPMVGSDSAAPPALPLAFPASEMAQRSNDRAGSDEHQH